MTGRQIAPYGSWTSPITADLIASRAIQLGQIALDGDDIYWIEQRPLEGGRNVIVRRTPDGRAADVTPAPFNARTRVHEYGGGAFTVRREVVSFTNFSDQQMYTLTPGGPPEPLTRQSGRRYADAIVDPQRDVLYCVQEDHTSSEREASNTIVAVNLNEGTSRVLASGNDFYSSPRLSPDGSRLAWLTWNHPNMPWDGTELWVARLNANGLPADARRVTGGPGDSIFQPEWSPDGVLHYVSDRTGWWNLYRWHEERIEPLCEMAAEFGQPQWGFGMATYGFRSPRRIVCAYCVKGTWHLGELDTQTRRLEPVETPYTSIASVRVRDGAAVFLGGSPTEPPSVVRLDLDTRKAGVLRRSYEVHIDPGYISAPETLEFPTENGQTAFGFYYPPENRDFAAPPNEKAPLLVFSHGGPTGATSSTLNLSIQFWTSRGFAVLDVNYGGSTGYGTAYRRRLNGRWGIVDVDDCANGARHLVARGNVDSARLAIRGGSAGGFTTLAALTFRDVFHAGASYFGVSDLEALALDTHKFESRYLDTMVGPYPERRDLYLQRSPLHHADRLSCPIILFQGMEDKVVPPNQAEMMRDALRRKGLPVAYLAFEGEQHGFRRAGTIRRCLEAELYFYSRIFGFAPADSIEPVPIENL
jgi:dipeptidyl aminopeptidase/acylaminoacyl peptidase